MRRFDLVLPGSVDECVRLLGERGPEAKLVAGGTDPGWSAVGSPGIGATRTGGEDGGAVLPERVRIEAPQ